jgi:hypothetical protein
VSARTLSNYRIARFLLLLFFRGAFSLRRWLPHSMPLTPTGFITYTEQRVPSIYSPRYCDAIGNGSSKSEKKARYYRNACYRMSRTLFIRSSFVGNLLSICALPHFHFQRLWDYRLKRRSECKVLWLIQSA